MGNRGPRANTTFHPSADYQSATRPINNLRYVCLAQHSNINKLKISFRFSTDNPISPTLL